MISVILITYNRSGLLFTTINSILNQSIKNIELLVIDDGSTDDSKFTVNSFGDSRIKYYNYGHLGDLAKLRNIGIDNSTGSFIAFCDDDDVWFPKKLEIQLSYLKEYDIVCSNSDVIDENNRIIQFKKFFKESSTNRIISTRDLLMGNTVITSSVILNKNVLKYRFHEKGSLFSAEDYELWLRLSLENKIFFLNECLLSFRKHMNTSSYREEDIQIEMLSHVIEIVGDYVKYHDKKIRLTAIKSRYDKRKEIMRYYIMKRNHFALFKELTRIMYDLMSFDVFEYAFLKCLMKKRIR